MILSEINYSSFQLDFATPPSTGCGSFGCSSVSFSTTKNCPNIAIHATSIRYPRSYMQLKVAQADSIKPAQHSIAEQQAHRLIILKTPHYSWLIVSLEPTNTFSSRGKVAGGCNDSRMAFLLREQSGYHER